MNRLPSAVLFSTVFAVACTPSDLPPTPLESSITWREQLVSEGTTHRGASVDLQGRAFFFRTDWDGFKGDLNMMDLASGEQAFLLEQASLPLWSEHSGLGFVGRDLGEGDEWWTLDVVGMTTALVADAVDTRSVRDDFSLMYLHTLDDEVLRWTPSQGTVSLSTAAPVDDVILWEEMASWVDSEASTTNLVFGEGPVWSTGAPTPAQVWNFSDDGSVAIVRAPAQDATLWFTQTGETVSLGAAQRWPIVLSADGSSVLFADPDGRIVHHDVLTGQQTVSAAALGYVPSIYANADHSMAFLFGDRVDGAGSVWVWTPESGFEFIHDGVVPLVGSVSDFQPEVGRVFLRLAEGTSGALRLGFWSSETGFVDLERSVTRDFGWRADLNQVLFGLVDSSGLPEVVAIDLPSLEVRSVGISSVGGYVNSDGDIWYMGSSSADPEVISMWQLDRETDVRTEMAVGIDYGDSPHLNERGRDLFYETDDLGQPRLSVWDQDTRTRSVVAENVMLEDPLGERTVMWDRDLDNVAFIALDGGERVLREWNFDTELTRDVERDVRYMVGSIDFRLNSTYAYISRAAPCPEGLCIGHLNIREFQGQTSRVHEFIGFADEHALNHYSFGVKHEDGTDDLYVAVPE